MEKIVFGNAVRSSADDVGPQEIKELECDLGVDLPDDFVSFYETVNGGYFIKNCWKTSDDIVYIVGQILPIKHSLSSSCMLLENSFKTLRDKGMLPGGLVPFAVDLGGNYICLRESDGVVFWLDHEKTLADDDSIVFPSGGFKDFVSGLLPEEELEDYL